MSMSALRQRRSYPWAGAVLLLLLPFLVGAMPASARDAPPLPAQPALGLDALIALNTAALGGAAALDAVHSMVKRSLIVEGRYRDIAIFATDRAGRMRVDIFADGERVFAESFDGRNAHQWRPGEGQTTASERGAAALSHTPQLPNHIFRLRDLRANGHSLEVLGSDHIDDTRYAVLKLTLADGFENFLWLNLDSGFVTRSRNTRALHVDIDDQQKVIESRMSDFRRVGNILHPHRVVEVDLKTGETLVEIDLLELRLNTPTGDAYFSVLQGAAAMPHRPGGPE